MLFLTNDPTSSRDELAARLDAIGIPATAADVLTSAAATARFLASREHFRDRRVLVVGAPAVQREIADAGFDLVAHADAPRAEIVVVGGHEEFDYAELRAATGAEIFGSSACTGDSTLNIRMFAERANRISSSVLPTPANTTRVVSAPAC